MEYSSLPLLSTTGLQALLCVRSPLNHDPKHIGFICIVKIKKIQSQKQKKIIKCFRQTISRSVFPYPSLIKYALFVPVSIEIHQSALARAKLHDAPKYLFIFLVEFPNMWLNLPEIVKTQGWFIFLLIFLNCSSHLRLETNVTGKDKNVFPCQYSPSLLLFLVLGCFSLPVLIHDHWGLGGDGFIQSPPLKVLAFWKVVSKNFRRRSENSSKLTTSTLF